MIEFLRFNITLDETKFKYFRRGACAVECNAKIVGSIPTQRMNYLLC